MALDIRKWSGKVKHAELPVDQPPAVAFTAFADVCPGATETEIGAGRILTLTFESCLNSNARVERYFFSPC